MLKHRFRSKKKVRTIQASISINYCTEFTKTQLYSESNFKRFEKGRKAQVREYQKFL